MTASPVPLQRGRSRRRLSAAVRLVAPVVWVASVVSLTSVVSVTSVVFGPARPAHAAGRPAPLDASGNIPTTGTTVPAAPVTVRLVQVAQAEQPVAVVQRPGDDALYVVEKMGRVRAFRGGQPDGVPVVDLRGRITTENERGLLGLAFKDNFLYLDYTDRKGQVVVSELPFDGKVADVARERVLLRIAKRFNEHNAGTIFFGPDSLLYIAIGDGGGSGDLYNNGQRVDTLLGKVLRIDPRPAPDGSLPYTIPSANPFARSAASVTNRGGPVRREILAFGLRNPWRISLDTATNTLWIPDVGQNVREEINTMPLDRAGANFGWRLREGTESFKGGRPPNAVDPVYDYPHRDGRCAVVGGAVYRGSALPALTGWYVFGDVCSGQLSVLRPDGGRWTPMSLGATVSYLTAFGVLNDGELVASSLEGGIFRLES